MLEEEVNESTEGTEVVGEEEIPHAAAETTEEDQSEEDVPEYTPDYGYKVYGEEREFDDWAKEILKAEGLSKKEVEENLRQLYAQAGGFDRQKEDYGKLKDEHGSLKGQHSELNQEVEELVHWMNTDLDTFFSKLGVDQQKVFDYVQQKLDEEKLDPAQRAQLRSRQDSLVQGYESSRSAERAQAENSRLRQEAFDADLDRTMSSPASADFVAQFDKAYGAGSFRGEVVNYGLAYHRQHGSDTTIIDAVNHVINRHKPVLERLTPVTDIESAKKAQEEGRPGGHIPNVGGGSVSKSPKKKLPKDFDEFKKMIANRIEELEG